MTKNKVKFNKSIELFHEHTGDIVRVIRFRKQKDFEEFINGFKSMRYPGYKWRFLNKKKREKLTKK